MFESTPTPDLLQAIVAATERVVEVRRAQVPLAELAIRALQASPCREAFRAALVRRGPVNVIAECKRRSPSRGILRREYDAAALARAYAAAGAAAISVVTEPTFFDGSLDDLRAVRAAVRLPVLRKDFIVSDYQVVEARANGADAILLIVAALAPPDLVRLQRRARELGLACLVEVHDEAELERALEAGADVIGVNNRNLRTLEVDLAAATRLIARMPAGVVAVAESGLKTGHDLRILRDLGYAAFLIGESLVTAPEPGALLGRLLAEAGPAVESAR